MSIRERERLNNCDYFQSSDVLARQGAYLDGLFDSTNLAAIHAKRVSCPRISSSPAASVASAPRVFFLLSGSSIRSKGLIDRRNHTFRFLDRKDIRANAGLNSRLFGPQFRFMRAFNARASSSSPSVVVSGASVRRAATTAARAAQQAKSIAVAASHRALEPRRRPRPSLLPRPNKMPASRFPAAASPSDDEDPLLVASSSSSLASQPIDWTAVALLFAAPALGGALFGYDIGATSGGLVSLKSALHSVAPWASSLNPLQSGAVVSASLAGALAGSAAAFTLGDKIGRKGELVAAGVLYSAGALATGGASSLPLLLLGRATYGLGIGLAMHAAPAYVAETAPATVRGLLISLKEGFIVGGILAGFVASAALVDSDGGWRVIWGAAALPGLLLALGAFFVTPESPRWLLLAGKGKAAARDALRRARGRGCPDAASLEAELDEMSSRGEGEGEGAAAAAAPPSLADLVTIPRFRRPLFLGLGLVIAQQITGQPSVLYYAPDVFASAGFAAGSQAASVAAGLGLFKLVATGVAVATVDKVGRRPLLIGGVATMSAALAVLAAAQRAASAASVAAAAATGGGATVAAVAAASSSSSPPLASWIAVAALLTYVGAYQVSFGPITWLLVGEIFPLAARGRAAALATLTNFGANAAVSLALPPLQAAAGPSATYLLFSVISVASAVLIAGNVPETKGKTLEEIEAVFSSSSSSEAAPRRED